MTVPVTFDYSELDEQMRDFVQERSNDIYERLTQIGCDVMMTGFALLGAKSSMSAAQFKQWVRTECNLSYATAVRYMRIAHRLGGKERLFSQPITVLNELAAPSTPDALIEAVENGTVLATLQAIKEVKHKRNMRALDSIFPGISTMGTPESVVLPNASSSMLE